ncbi:MAG: ECF transporter S component [Candidatus Fimenecus sp.]
MSNAKPQKTRRQKTVLLVETAMLAAIVVVMALTPIGYLRVGPLELTLIMVPVIIGAVTCGPAVGALLGGVFGITSFVQCFMGSPLGAILVTHSIPRTFLVCVVTRILAGLFCGLLFKVCFPHDKKGSWSYLVAGITGSLFNTLFFLGALALLFWGVTFTPEQAAALGGVDTMLKTVIAIAAGLNAPIELLVCAVLGSAVGKGVAVALRKVK